MRVFDMALGGVLGGSRWALGVGAAGLALGLSTPAFADLLLPLQERMDWQFRQNIGVEFTQVGDLYLQVAYTDGDIFHTDNIQSDSLDDDWVSVGAIGQAVDPVTGQRWIGGVSQFADAAEGDLIGNPISGITDIAATGGHLIFPTEDGTLALRYVQSGHEKVYDNIIPAGSTGLTAEQDRYGNYRLLVGNGNQIYQYAMTIDYDEDADEYLGLSLDLLRVDSIGGNTALGINDLDYANGRLYTVTMAGIAEFPYQIIDTPPRTDASNADVLQQNGDARESARPERR